MSVPKGKQRPSRFEAAHHFYEVRREITTLIILDFGFSEEKYQKNIEKYRQAHAHSENVDEIVARYEKKCQNFKARFINREADAVLELLRNIETEFSIGNSINISETPAKLIEFIARRIHINRAIGYCYALKQELNYTIRTLPVDINKYERFAGLIDKQIGLYKGVRHGDNKRIGAGKHTLTDALDGFVAVIKTALEQGNL